MHFSQKEVLQELEGLLTGRWITDLSNTAALLMLRFSDINWVGFYLTSEDMQTLWLGPFQGQPACTMIPFSKGVCGTAASQKKTIRISDVTQFAGHIVCDVKSRSEIVVPLIRQNQVIGVLDVDSASVDRFSETDQKFFEDIVNLLLEKQRSDSL